MKENIKIGIVFVIIVVLSILMSSCISRERHRYIGIVTEKNIYSSKNGPTYNIVFYCKNKNKYVSIEVSGNTYYNLKKGEVTVFNLRDWEVE